MKRRMRREDRLLFVVGIPGMHSNCFPLRRRRRRRRRRKKEEKKEISTLSHLPSYLFPFYGAILDIYAALLSPLNPCIKRLERGLLLSLLRMERGRGGTNSDVGDFIHCKGKEFEGGEICINSLSSSVWEECADKQARQSGNGGVPRE